MPETGFRAAVFISFLLLSPSLIFAQPVSADPLEEVLATMRSIEKRMERIEAGQKEIFARDERIQAKLAEVRVWSARRQRLVSQS